MTPHAADQDLHELRPAPGVVLRHRGAELDVHDVARSGPRVDLRRGALWIRSEADGPGVTVTHGAASIQLRTGAVVVEVHGVEGLLLVASGHAAVKGSGPLARSVAAGQAVALMLDGTTSEPDRLSPDELAADRMVVENLARDLLASRESLPDEPVEIGVLTDEVPLPRLRPRPELLLRSEVLSLRKEPSALETALANVGVGDVAPAPPEADAGFAPEPLGGEPVGRDLAPVDEVGDGGAGPGQPEDERGEGDLAGNDLVTEESPAAVDDSALGAFFDEHPVEAGASDGARSAGVPPSGAATWPDAEDRARRRKILALIVVAMVVLAIFAAVVLSTSG